MYWHGASHATFPPRPELAYVFTAQETARLVIYRAAIRAGFYNNW
jgi:hypothetical protein